MPRSPEKQTLNINEFMQQILDEFGYGEDPDDNQVSAKDKIVADVQDNQAAGDREKSTSPADPVE